MPNLLLTLALVAAAAEDGADADASFLVSTPAGAYRITKWRSPPPAVLDADDRTCRLSLRWAAPGLEVTARDCPAEVAREAEQTLRDQWTVEPLSQSRATEHHLGEVWFVYPSRVGGSVRTWMRQAPDQTLRLPDGIDAVPFEVQAWAFLRYPAELVGERPAVASCTVSLDVDPRGFPTVVSVDGCDDPFRAAASDTLSQWRFKAPEVDGEPAATGVVIETTFDPEDSDLAAGGPPSEESHALWANRQFEQLTREERLWFIRASLLGPPRDLGPGQVSVRLPPPPELRDRVAPEWFGEPGTARRPVRPLPDHPPVFVLGREGRPEIEAWDLTPPATEGLGKDELRCTLTVQVDSDRSVWGWAQRGACDEAVRRGSIQAVERWILRHTAENNPEARELFEVTLVYPVDGPSEVWLPESLLRSAPEALPARVHTTRPPTLLTRVPPQLPRRLLAEGLEGGTCRFAVTVDPRGRPARVQRLECPESWAKYAERSVRRYRWEPAAVDGEPHEGRDEVIIRFAD